MTIHEQYNTHIRAIQQLADDRSAELRTREAERDAVTRTKTALQLQADELERASRYKSDFLANMSHELRTPLNSSLILAKLLADNPSGNLTDEQVRYAETIQSAGNDLLVIQDARTGKDVLLPSVKEFVKAVDVAGGVINVEPIPGFFDEGAVVAGESDDK